MVSIQLLFCSSFNFCFPLIAAKLKQVLKLNEHQRSALETFFTLHHFPNKTALNRLAMQTGLSEKQVYHWFGKKRFITRQGKCEYIIMLTRRVQ